MNINVSNKLGKNLRTLSCLFITLALTSSPIFAQTEWVDWSTAISSSEGGHAEGVLEIDKVIHQGIDISYDGEVLLSESPDYVLTTTNGASKIWGPPQSFVSNEINIGPNKQNDAIFLKGVLPGENKITFKKPLLNPYIAIYSLGTYPGVTAPVTLTFFSTPSITSPLKVVAKGPANRLDGTCCQYNSHGLQDPIGNIITDDEGNGVVKFLGRISDISFTVVPSWDAGESFAFTVGVNIRDVSIDIKPGSDPNAINLKNMGNVPVAIMGSSELDVATINQDTVNFAGTPKKSIRNVTSDVNGDGFPDIILHFLTQKLQLSQTDTKACISGELQSGELFQGCDTVKIVKINK